MKLATEVGIEPTVVQLKIQIDFKLCACCSKQFVSIKGARKGRKCCSAECVRINQTYRKLIHLYEHAGLMLKLESSWEVDIAKWLDKLKIEWVRPKHIGWIDSVGKHRKYFPDFYLPTLDLYLDPKNKYQISISREKLEAIQSKVKLIYGEVEFIKSTVQRILESNQASKASS